MSRIRSFAGLAAAVLLVGTASLAQAQTSNGYYWNAGTAPWSNSNNWTSGAAPSGAYGGSVIDNNGTATIASGDNVTDNASDGYIFLGDTSGNGYVNQSGGVLNPGITTGAYRPAMKRWAWRAVESTPNPAASMSRLRTSPREEISAR